MIDVVLHGLGDAALMAWQTWWALVLGFAISAVVQAWVPRERIQATLGGTGPRSVAVATGLGAASSSCSYSAIAIGRSLFAKGASGATSIAFAFASTNLVWELGLVLWLLIGWQFALAEYVGGVVMIVLMAATFRLVVPRRVEQDARDHARDAAGGHDHGGDETPRTWRERLTSRAAWRSVGGRFVMDWSMLWKEIAIGFLVAGFVAQLGDGVFRSLFVTDAPGIVTAIENVLVGPLIAVLSFVCSVGNVPLAAVLWSGGISFAGVLAFLFADLVILPIVLVYRRYYGAAFTWRIVLLMLATMVVAALVVDALFSGAGLVPTGPRPSRDSVFGSVQVDYKLVLNVVGVAIAASLWWVARSKTASHAE